MNSFLHPTHFCKTARGTAFDPVTISGISGVILPYILVAIKVSFFTSRHFLKTPYCFGFRCRLFCLCRRFALYLGCY